MRTTAAVGALSALANDHRLEIFRLLVQRGPEGLSAGMIAARLKMPASSLSFHLGQLRNAGLVETERRHRNIIYRADYPAMAALVGYLTDNCCGGATCSVAPPPPTKASRKGSVHETSTRPRSCCRS